jgi:hypothetical protein
VDREGISTSRNLLSGAKLDIPFSVFLIITGFDFVKSTIWHSPKDEISDKAVTFFNIAKTGRHLSKNCTIGSLFLFLNGQGVKTAIEVTYFLHDFKFKILHVFVGVLRVVRKTHGAHISRIPENYINLIGAELIAVSLIRAELIGANL